MTMWSNILYLILPVSLPFINVLLGIDYLQYKVYFAQGLALTEIMFNLSGNKYIAFLQVMSRFFILFYVMNCYASDNSWWTFTKAYTICIWSLAEIPRYSYYCLTSMGARDGRVYRILQSCRYNLFIILYPLGVLGEIMCLYNANLLLCIVAYAYYFPILYKHMFTQRLKKELNTRVQPLSHSE